MCGLLHRAQLYSWVLLAIGVYRIVREEQPAPLAIAHKQGISFVGRAKPRPIVRGPRSARERSKRYRTPPRKRDLFWDQDVTIHGRTLRPKDGRTSVTRRIRLDAPPRPPLYHFIDPAVPPYERVEGCNARIRIPHHDSCRPPGNKRQIWAPSY